MTDKWLIEAKAPGKLILLGEYAVLYGNTGIVTTLDLWTTVRITPSAERKLVILLDELNLEVSLDIYEIQNHLENFEYEIIPPLKLLECESSRTSMTVIWNMLCEVIGVEDFRRWEIIISISSEIQMGKGLGSSGAFSVALAAALLQHSNHYLTPSLDLIRGSALKSENTIHGKTSGIDVEVSLLGGTRAFKNGQSRLVRNPSESYHIVLIDTGIPRNSKMMISAAKASLAGMNEEEMDTILTELELLAVKLVDDCGDFEKILPIYQNFLQSIGVSNSNIESFISAAKNCSLSSKNTGAGGGGFIYVLLPRGLLYWIKLWHLKWSLAQDPRTKDHHYKLSNVALTEKGVQISFQNFENKD